VNHGLAANEFSGQAEGAGRDLTAPCGLRGEAEKIGGGDTGWIDRLAAGREFLDGSWTGQTLPERRLPGTIVDAFTEAFESPFAREA